MAIRIDHISIRTADLERSARFYCDGLGFSVVEGGDVAYSSRASDADRGMLYFPLGYDFRGRARHLRRDGFDLMLNGDEVPRPVARPPATAGFCNWALVVEDEDIDDLARRLCALGGTLLEERAVTFEAAGVVYRQIACADPDGEIVEITTTVGPRANGAAMTPDRPNEGETWQS